MYKTLSSNDRYIAIRNATLVGVLVNILLTIIKFIFGILGHSQALIADALHSLSDLISDGLVLVAAKFSSQDADDEHPYGHARFETVATVAVGLLLFLVAVGIFIDAIRRLFFPELLLQPTAITLVITLIVLVAKEILYQYTIFVAKKINSPMLRANAWHHRSDAISSFIVLIGIAGALMGFSWLDAVAAIGVSFMIAHIGWSLMMSSFKELVDTGLDQDKINQITETIQSVEGVRALHELRTRKMANNALVDVHILVDPYISVSEGHYIAEIVKSTLIDKFEEISDVMVHIDPENDEEFKLNFNLPLRSQVIQDLQQSWYGLAVTKHIEQITLHYISGKLIVDVYLPLNIVTSLEEAADLSKCFNELADNTPSINTVNLYYR
jgi:cation diffusion facilitator family transporter